MYIQKKRLIILAIVLLLTTAAAPFAKNLIPTADQKISLTPAEAMPQSETQDYFKGTVVISNNASGLENFFIPIHLPGSKEITQLIIYYSDNTASNSPCFQLFTTSLVDGTSNNIADVCGTGTTTGIETLTVSNINETITPSTGLVLVIKLADNHSFYGAKVFYRKP